MFEHRFVSLLGPNRWSHVPMLELHYAESLALRPVHLAQSMSTQLLQFLASNGYTTTHPQSVQNATTLAESLPHYDCHADIFLMSAKWFSAMAGIPTQTAVIEKELRSLSIGCEATMVVAMEMEEYELSRRCYELSAEFMDCIENNREFPLATKFRELFDYADDVRLGPSSRAILRAARRRDIPYMRLNRGSLVQLGEGKYQRRIWTAETDATSAIAVHLTLAKIAKDNAEGWPGVLRCPEIDRRDPREGLKQDIGPRPLAAVHAPPAPEPQGPRLALLAPAAARP